MQWLKRPSLVMFGIGAVTTALIAINSQTTRTMLPRAEATSRVASARMVVFVPTNVGAQPSGYLDGRPVPSGLPTPIIVRWPEGDIGNVAIAPTAVPPPTTQMR